MAKDLCWVVERGAIVEGIGWELGMETEGGDWVAEEFISSNRSLYGEFLRFSQTMREGLGERVGRLAINSNNQLSEIE